VEQVGEVKQVPGELQCDEDQGEAEESVQLRGQQRRGQGGVWHQKFGQSGHRLGTVGTPRAMARISQGCRAVMANPAFGPIIYRLSAHTPYSPAPSTARERKPQRKGKVKSWVHIIA
jgi:hypothetical protein